MREYISAHATQSAGRAGCGMVLQVAAGIFDIRRRADLVDRRGP